MRLLHEIAIFQTVKSKVIISLFETVKLSVSISLRNLNNSLTSIKEKSVIVCSEKISYFFTSDGYDLYFFTVANRSCLDNLGLNFFQKRSGMHRSCLTLRYGCTRVK